jgi:general secretion pathway protein D
MKRGTGRISARRAAARPGQGIGRKATRLLPLALLVFYSAPAAAEDKHPAPPVSLGGAPSSPAAPPLSTPAMPPPDAGIEHSPKKPGELVALSLQNAELGDLAKAMGELTGKRFVVLASPKSFQATVFAPEKVTVSEAYQAFLSILAANHLTVVPQGRYYKIIDAQDALHEAPVRSSSDGLPAEERFVTYVHRVAHLSAEEVAASVLSKLASHDGSIIPYGNVLFLTDTATNVQRMMRVLDEIDVAQAEDKLWLVPLQFVSSADVKKELEEVLDGASGRSPSGHAADGASGQSPSGHAADARVTKLVALDHPNALLVVGSEAGCARLLDIVRPIDVASPGESRMHVVLLEHADAKKLVDALNQAVTAAQGSGAPGGGGKPGLGGLESQVKISAEETNNALIVTASAHDFAAIREVIRDLDRPRRQVYIEAVVMDLDVQRTTQMDAAMHGFGDLNDALGAGSVLYGGANPLASILLPTDSTALQGLVLGVRGPSIPVPDFLAQPLGISSIPGLGFFLDAYAVASNGDILQTPHVLATDNIPATIYVQLNTSLQRNAASYGVPGAAGAQSASALGSLSLLSAPAAANYGKIGPKIKITPHLNESDDVRLDVEETISDLTADPPQGTLGTVDFVERGATTTLTVRDQRTAIIGGLVRDKVTHAATKVPLLGDIPVLGALFRSSKDVVEKANLVLVLTPYIVRDEDDMRHILEKRMQERQEFLDHYFVFRDSPRGGAFEPARSRGLLAELRASQRDVDARRKLESPPPATTITYDLRPPLDLPSLAPATNHAKQAAPAAQATTGASMPPLNVTPPLRKVEHVER